MQVIQAKNRWIDARPEEWSTALAAELLQALQEEDHFKIEAALGTRTLDSGSQLAILEAAIASTERLLSHIQSNGVDVLSLVRNAGSDQVSAGELQLALENNEDARRLLERRLDLFELQYKTLTYQEIYGTGSSPIASGSGSPRARATPAREDDEHEDETMEESWQFDEDNEPSSPASESITIEVLESQSSPEYQLSTFLEIPLVDLAFTYASQARLSRLRLLFKRHARDLNPSRLPILDSIPLFTEVSDYIDLLPTFDAKSCVERIDEGEPWRHGKVDWQSEAIVREMLGKEVTNWSPATAEQLAEWYKRRVQELDEETGLVDISLALIQHGASQGLPGLDALGEQISLLSRLVYDRRAASSDSANQEAWSLQKWKSASAADIVDAYLSQSSPQSIVQDIRGQVMPYLYVLESQREREGFADTTLHTSMLFDWILRNAASNTPDTLDCIVAIFQASKPTLPSAQRIIKDNSDLARLALAVCYGHPGTSYRSVQAMLQIIDCLPSLEEQVKTTVDDGQTLRAITYSTGAQRSPSEIYSFMQSWSTTALSRALDTMDLHLEAAEIFQRWSSPVTLQFFTKLSADEKSQRLWADRLAKTSPAAVANSQGTSRIGSDFADEDEWISLLDDLCKLGGKGSYSDGDPKPAFSSLNQQEITKIFFSGLLSSGKFNLARSLFNASSGERPLDTATEQSLVLAASREFYDNADSGNLHSGNMKLALDCLTVAPNTPEVRRERDFIEATSRLASYNVLNDVGEPLTPIEIRLTEDKLSLVSRLLASNEEAYRHPDVILELVAKLGYRGDALAETRVLSMLADAALQAGDAKRAGDVCDRMIKAVEQIRRSRNTEKVSQAAELAWKTCFQFGKQGALGHTQRRKELLGQALLLCPPSKIGEVLAIWQVTDDNELPQRSPKKHKGISSPKSASVTSPTSLGANLSLPFSLPSRPSTPSSITHSAESAARAALMVGRAASSYLPFRTGTPDNSLERPMSPASLFDGLADRRPTSSQRTGQSPASDAHVRHALENRFKAGVGWLLGADEDEL